MKATAIKKLFGAGPQRLTIQNGGGGSLPELTDLLWEQATERVFEQLGDASWADYIQSFKQQLIDRIIAKFGRLYDVKLPTEPDMHSPAWSVWYEQGRKFENASHALTALILAQLEIGGFVNAEGRSTAEVASNTSTSGDDRYAVQTMVWDYEASVAHNIDANLNWNLLDGSKYGANIDEAIDNYVAGNIDKGALIHIVKDNIDAWVDTQMQG